MAFHWCWVADELRIKSNTRNATFCLIERQQGARYNASMLAHTPYNSSPTGFRVCRFSDTSSASSSTRFMYSSKPWNRTPPPVVHMTRDCSEIGNVGAC